MGGDGMGGAGIRLAPDPEQLRDVSISSLTCVELRPVLPEGSTPRLFLPVCPEGRRHHAKLPLAIVLRADAAFLSAAKPGKSAAAAVASFFQASPGSS